MALVVALHAAGCASQASSNGFLTDDGGETSSGSSSGNGGNSTSSSSGAGPSGSGGGSSGGASSSGSGAGAASGSASSSGAGSSTSSSGSKATDGGSACVSSCKMDQECQASCGAVRPGYVWCCGSSTCYQWTTACPVPTDGSGSSSSSSSGSSSGGGGADAAVSDAVCQAMATNAACQQCCVTNHMHGYNTYLTSEMACACGTTGVCKTQCATEFCASAQTTQGDACDTCLNNSLSADGGGTCLTPVTNACLADADCLALLSTTGCVSGCP